MLHLEGGKLKEVKENGFKQMVFYYNLHNL